MFLFLASLRRQVRWTTFNDNDKRMLCICIIRQKNEFIVIRIGKRYEEKEK